MNVRKRYYDTDDKHNKIWRDLTFEPIAEDGDGRKKEEQDYFNKTLPNWVNSENAKEDVILLIWHISEHSVTIEAFKKQYATWIDNSKQHTLIIFISGGGIREPFVSNHGLPPGSFVAIPEPCSYPAPELTARLNTLIEYLEKMESTDFLTNWNENSWNILKGALGYEEALQILPALDILVQGYLATTYLGKGDLQIEEVENAFKALKETKGLRSPKELETEASEGKLAPFRLFRPLCFKNNVVCDNSNGKASPKPFEGFAECNYWFDSVLYEVYSDCPEKLSGNPSFFTNATDAEVQDLANFLGSGAETDLFKGILGLNESLIAARTLCPKLRSNDPQVYAGNVTGGAIRVIWELIRSGLNKEVVQYHASFSGDATPIIESLGPLFGEKWSGSAKQEDVIEVLCSLAFLEFRKAHELVTQAAVNKKKIESFVEYRTRLNHRYLKNDFLSIFGKAQREPYDTTGVSQELLSLNDELGKHRDAIDSWNERIKPELLEFFMGDSFGPNIKPKESFGILAEDCRKWIEALDRFVVKVWPSFFQSKIGAKKKETETFFTAGINLYQAIRSLRVELDFFKYFSVRD